MDAYSSYNQILMDQNDCGNTTFKTKTNARNLSYKVMPIDLKNARKTYLRMMNKLYMDDMIVKSSEESDHATHFKVVFKEVRRSNTCLNPNKCQFGIKPGNFRANTLKGE